MFIHPMESNRSFIFRPDRPSYILTGPGKGTACIELGTPLSMARTKKTTHLWLHHVEWLCNRGPVRLRVHCVSFSCNGYPWTHDWFICHLCSPGWNLWECVVMDPCQIVIDGNFWNRKLRAILKFWGLFIQSHLKPGFSDLLIFGFHSVCSAFKGRDSQCLGQSQEDEIGLGMRDYYSFVRAVRDGCLKHNTEQPDAECLALMLKCASQHRFRSIVVPKTVAK